MMQIVNLEIDRCKKFNRERYLSMNEEENFIRGQEAYVRRDYKEAKQKYEASVEAGNIYSLTRIGLLYYYGLGVKPDKIKAYEYLYKAANEGCALAKVWLADYIRLGMIFPANEKLSEEIYKEARSELYMMCDCNDMFSIYFFGFNYWNAIGGFPRDRNRAFRLVKRAAEMGCHEALIYEARIFYHLDNYERAYQMLSQSHLTEYCGYHSLMGRLIYEGLGCSKDIDVGVSHMKHCAEFFGNTKAKLFLAKHYCTEKDYMITLGYLKDLAENYTNRDAAEASELLAQIYLFGIKEHVPQDINLATEYLLHACDLGQQS